MENRHKIYRHLKGGYIKYIFDWKKYVEFTFMEDVKPEELSNLHKIKGTEIYIYHENKPEDN